MHFQSFISSVRPITTISIIPCLFCLFVMRLLTSEAHHVESYFILNCFNGINPWDILKMGVHDFLTLYLT